MFKILHSWFKRRRVNEQPATNLLEAPTSSPSNPQSTSAANSTVDLDLLGRAMTQWQFGAWESLTALDNQDLQHHPDRAWLALLAAAGHQQLNNLKAARELITLALDWGCDRKAVAQILISGTHNALGRAALLNNQTEKAHLHFSAAVRTGSPSTDATLVTPARIDTQLLQLRTHGFVSNQRTELNREQTSENESSLSREIVSSSLNIEKLTDKRLAVFVWYRSDKGGGLHENIRDTITYARHIFKEVVIVCPRSTFAEQFEAAGARVLEVDYDNIDLPGLYKALGDMDLVHVHPGKSRQIGVEYAKLKQRPVVMTIHGKWFDAIENFHADISHIISVSRYIEEQIRAKIPNIRSKLSTIENGVDLKIFPFSPSALLTQPRKYVICCSRLDEDKRGLIDSLLSLWKLQAQLEIDIPWLLVGDGPSRQQLEGSAAAIFRRHPLVTFAGWRQKNELAVLYQRAFASLSPGRSALESMACGIPTISCGSSGGLKVIDSHQSLDTVIYTNFGGYGSDHESDSLSACMTFLQQANEGHLDMHFFLDELTPTIRQNFDAWNLNAKLVQIYAHTC